MSDHDAINFEVLTSLEKHKLQERKYFNITKLTKVEFYLLWLNFVKILTWIHTTEQFKSTTGIF